VTEPRARGRVCVTSPDRRATSATRLTVRQNLVRTETDRPVRLRHQPHPVDERLTVGGDLGHLPDSQLEEEIPVGRDLLGKGQGAGQLLRCHEWCIELEQPRPPFGCEPRLTRRAGVQPGSAATNRCHLVEPWRLVPSIEFCDAPRAQAFERYPTSHEVPLITFERSKSSRPASAWESMNSATRAGSAFISSQSCPSTYRRLVRQRAESRLRSFGIRWIFIGANGPH